MVIRFLIPKPKLIFSELSWPLELADFLY